MAERGKGTHLIIFTHADAGAKGTVIYQWIKSDNKVIIEVITG